MSICRVLRIQILYPLDSKHKSYSGLQLDLQKDDEFKKKVNTLLGKKGFDEFITQ